MTLQDLDAALKAVCAATYELAAPPGVTRCVVWHQYGERGLAGGDAVGLAVPRVQIDIRCQSTSDSLPGLVKAKLSALCLPYEVVDVSYEDESALMRWILQLWVI